MIRTKLFSLSFLLLQKIMRWAKRKTNFTIIGGTVRMFEALIWMHVLIRGARDDFKKPCFMGVCTPQTFLTVRAPIHFRVCKLRRGDNYKDRALPIQYWLFAYSASFNFLLMMMRVLLLLDTLIQTLDFVYK
jgi:hypothetical protein